MASSRDGSAGVASASKAKAAATAAGGGGCASELEVLEWPTTAEERDGCAFFEQHWDYYANCLPDNPKGLTCEQARDT